ncbi:MAG: cell division protein FtsL [Betaproteobacteria bacterium]|nr:cell division protein FtsL [Betaproteobacteria bacterium]
MARLNLLLLALIVLSSLALITSQHQARKLYNELQVELASAKRFEEEMGRLQIEQSTWSTPTRIEKVARERLGMRLPDAGHTRVLGNDVSARGGSQ